MLRVFSCVLLTACTTSSRIAGDAAVDAAPPPPPLSSAPTAKDAAIVVVVADSLAGEWERQTEPYRGMRVSIRDGLAVVTLAPPVTQERLSSQARSTSSASPAVAKAQLECQRSLWKPGDELITGITKARAPRPGNDEGGGFEATILVRDWGFTGTCRHADSHAPARLAVSSAGDELTVTVTRGKTVTPQQWSRVVAQ